MEDYKEEIKKIITTYYDAEDFGGAEITKSTIELLKSLQGIIPSQPITEHDIYEVMKEMGFSIVLNIIKEKVCIFEGDKEAGIPAEYDEVEISRVFLWKLYEKM